MNESQNSTFACAFPPYLVEKLRIGQVHLALVNWELLGQLCKASGSLITVLDYIPDVKGYCGMPTKVHKGLQPSLVTVLWSVLLSLLPHCSGEVWATSNVIETMCLQIGKILETKIVVHCPRSLSLGFHVEQILISCALLLL